MFGQFFGEYLLNAKLITLEQFDELDEYQHSLRINLGMIAVSEHFITEKQANEINRLQSVMDKRFGDIAVEKGYLTKKQVHHLVNLQGNPYLLFEQGLIAKNIMALNEIETQVKNFKEDNQFTESELEILKSGNIDDILPIFITVPDSLTYDHFAIAVRTIVRFITSRISLKKVYSVSEYEFDTLASQCLKGVHNIFFGFAAKNKNLLSIANPFAKADFTELEEDAFDSVCEFINCINGIYASELSQRDIEQDMLPPISYVGKKLTSNGKLYVLPAMINGHPIELILSDDIAVNIISQ